MTKKPRLKKTRFFLPYKMVRRIKAAAALRGLSTSALIARLVRSLP